MSLASHQRAPFSALRGARDFLAGRAMPALLESARPHPEYGRASIACGDPLAALSASREGVHLDEGRGWRRLDADPFSALDALLDELGAGVRSGRDEGFQGALVGWLGYDAARHLERVPERARDDLLMPELVVGVYDEALLLEAGDARPRHVVAEALRRRRVPGARIDPRAVMPRSPIELPPRTFTRATYEAAVAAVRGLIAEGEVYQVNLSQRFAGPLTREPFALYERLRALSPAPFMAFLEAGERALISCSPEEFLRVEGRRVVARPIKGTRRRDADPKRDRALSEELLASAKDRAELTMIVDLLRNDLGRVARPGSVRVPALVELEEHPTLWHLAGRIEAELRDGAGLVELLRASFPCGSITGAPKIRAMEIIDALEPTRRGVFTGSVFWIDLAGALRSSVAIRTIECHGRLASFQVGGGVVWDSEPAAEYEETLAKGAALARALGEDAARWGVEEWR